MDQTKYRWRSWHNSGADKARDWASVRAFSLVEILAVLAILSMLSGLLVTGLPSVFSARASAQASTLAAELLAKARQQALTQGQPVAVIFSKPFSAESRQAIMLLSGSVEGTELKWQAVSPWHQLADGIRVDPVKHAVADVETSVSATVDSLYQSTSRSLDIPNIVRLDGRQVSEYFFLIFRPDGSIDAPEIAPSIEVGRYSKKALNDYTIIAQENTGRIKVVAN